MRFEEFTNPKGERVLIAVDAIEVVADIIEHTRRANPGIPAGAKVIVNMKDGGQFVFANSFEEVKGFLIGH